jgi:glycosyltransferase involved in cell wall biosynthesis
MGSLELAWMRRKFPAWTSRLGVYDCATPAAEQAVFARVAAVRRQRAAEAPRQGTRFLWIGRWAAHKGIDRLLDFLARRLPAEPEDTVTLAGCGEAAARDIPPPWIAAGRVRIVPSYTRSELPELLAAHEAGLFTSHVEGWGLSLNEMLESGLPVYATEAGGVADLRPFFPGRLLPFPPSGARPAALAEDPESRGYFRRFSWSAIARAYEEQVAAACGGRP